MQPFQLQVSLVRNFRRIKAAFAQTTPIYHQLNAPFSLVRADTQKARFIGFSRLSDVLQVAKPRDFPQIVKPIILFVAVFMVNMLHWKRASHIQPSKPMRQSFCVVYRDSPISGVCRAAGTFADKIRPARVNFPRKFASIWAVIQNRTKMVSSNHELQFTIGATK